MRISTELAANKSVIVVVHGTFAKENETNPAWWQNKSEFLKKLFTRLEKIEGLNADERPSNSIVFKWSGRNSEQDRRQAGAELLDSLRQLERSGIPYHIVAHSHGGAVVWNALKFSLKSGIANDEWFRRGEETPLRLLRSWTTVGTPFLRSRQPWVSKNLFLAALLPMMASSLFLSWFLHKGFKWILKKDLQMDHVWWLIGVRAQLMPFVTALGIALTNNWLLHKEREAEKLAVKAYASRWLGIWSDEDEAFAGLKGSFAPDRQLVPRLRSGMHSVPFSKIALWNSLRFYNKVIAPYLDRSIWKKLSATAQGNDRLGHSYEGSCPEPTPLLSGVPPIMPSFTQELRTQAEEAITSKVPRLRANIMGALLSSANGIIFTKILPVLDSDQLVHCLYFQGEMLPEIVATHICHELGCRLNRASIEFISNDEIREYILTAKKHIESCILQ